MASSPEVAANSLKLELRWIKLAEKANTGIGRLGFSTKAPAPIGARPLDPRVKPAGDASVRGGCFGCYAARMTLSS